MRGIPSLILYIMYFYFLTEFLFSFISSKVYVLLLSPGLGSFNFLWYTFIFGQGILLPVQSSFLERNMREDELKMAHSFSLWKNQNQIYFNKVISWLILYYDSIDTILSISFLPTIDNMYVNISVYCYSDHQTNLITHSIRQKYSGLRLELGAFACVLHS